MQNLTKPRSLAIIGVIVLVLVGGYFLMAYDRNTPEPAPSEVETVQEAEEVTENENTMTVALAAQNDSGQDGTAILTEENGQVTVEIQVPAGDGGVPQPAHIHTGACPTPGAVVYPLTNVVDGQSETTLDLTLEQIRNQLPLAINIHKSMEEQTVYTSCGDLE